MDLQVVFILLVILENKMLCIVIVRHMSEHLEDLLKGRLGGGVLRDGELFLLVL